MNIEEILDALDELLDTALTLPLSGGKCVVDADKIRSLVDDIRLNLPSEMKQAKGIVSDRGEIISVAKREAEGIMTKAEERAKALIAQDEIYRQAQERAADTLRQAQQKSREMRAAAQEFSDQTMRFVEEAMVKSLGELRSTRQALKSSGKNTASSAQQPSQSE